MAAHDQLLESVHVQDVDVAAVYFHQSLVTQVRDAPTDGFKAQSQVGANFLPTHFQHKAAG
ncbi:hypothetical protein D3C87_1945800 [compost metagenome]